MPIVTQTRPNPDSDIAYYFGRGDRYGSIPKLNPMQSREQATQTTTSFRSRVPNNAEVELDFGQPGVSQYDKGNDFYTSKTWFRAPIHTVGPGRQNGSYGDYVFRGNLFPGSRGAGVRYLYPSHSKMTKNEINREGASFIADTIPTNSAAELSTFLGELISSALPGVPALQSLKGLKEGSARQTTSDLGSDYLNWQFGVKPMISDIRSMIEAVKNSSKLISQYERDSGKVVRRRRTRPAIISTTQGETYGIQGLDDSTSTGLGLRWTTQPSWIMNTRTVYSFSGAYSYHLDVGDGARAKLKAFEDKADYLLGLRVDLSTLWNLAPWSWFADWFGNMGDILHNVDAFSANGLVLRYGYLMKETTSVKRYQMPTCTGPEVSIPSHPLIFGRRTKERVKAHPYGFGVSDSSLSSYQWSILSALGMTKAQRSRH